MNLLFCINLDKLSREDNLLIWRNKIKVLHTYLEPFIIISVVMISNISWRVITTLQWCSSFPSTLIWRKSLQGNIICEHEVKTPKNVKDEKLHATFTRRVTNSMHLLCKAGNLLSFRSSRRVDLPMLSSISLIIPDITLSSRAIQS